MPPASVRSWTQQSLRRYKTDRMWNINANIVAADVLSTVATALVIEALQGKLPTPFTIVTVTAAIDGVISFAAFACLHTWVNRDRGMKDLARVQVHRWALSPLHYLVGIGIQYALLAAGVRRAGVGVLVAYWSAVAVVRTLHTRYGQRSGLFH